MRNPGITLGKGSGRGSQKGSENDPNPSSQEGSVTLWLVPAKMIQIRAPRKGSGERSGERSGQGSGQGLGQDLLDRALHSDLGRDLDRDLRQDLLDRDLGKNPSRIGGG